IISIPKNLKYSTRARRDWWRARYLAHAADHGYEKAIELIEKEDLLDERQLYRMDTELDKFNQEFIDDRE
ncbi:MAG: hypothetical protein AAF637_08325, partial [Pseudomonadota bacterium]